MKPILMMMALLMCTGCLARFSPGKAPKFGTIFTGIPGDAPATAAPDAVQTQPIGAVQAQPVDTGLVRREPDSCGAEDLAQLVGQPEGMMRTVHTKGKYRVITPGAIVTQEYDSSRLGVHIDADGVIQRFSCG